MAEYYEDIDDIVFDEEAATPVFSVPDVTEEPVVKKTVRKKKKKKRLKKWVKATLCVLVLAGIGFGVTRVYDVKQLPGIVQSKLTSLANKGKESETLAIETNTTTASSEAETEAETVEIAQPEEKPSDKEVIEGVLSVKLPEGNMGRLYIGEWSVALNKSENNLSDEIQEFTNNPDSAAYIEYNDKVMIADHANQGFDKLLEIQKGDIIAIAQGDNIKWLKCTSVHKDAYSKDGYSMLADGTDVWVCDDGDYFLQTNIDTSGLTLCVVYFEEV